MVVATFILWVVACVMFLLDAFGVPSRIRLTPLGWFLFTAGELLLLSPRLP